MLDNPHNLDAERALLGAILTDASAHAEVADRISAEMFYRSAHREVYEAVCWLAGNGEAIDSVTVSDFLRRQQRLEKVGGLAYLTGIGNEGLPANIKTYADQVRFAHFQRRLVECAHQIGTIGNTPGERNLDALLADAEAALLNVTQQGISGDLQHIGGDVLHYWDNLYQHRNEPVSGGIGTGLSELDAILGGLHRGELLVLAARPSQGKSSLMRSIAYHVAKDQHDVAIYSLEVGSDYMKKQFIQGTARLPGHLLRSGYLTEEQWQRGYDAAGRLAGLSLYIDDSATATTSDIWARARRLKARHGLDVLMVDYLQLLNDRGDGNENQRVAEMSRRLKGMARDLDCAVVCLSQLNRAVESRVDRKPKLSDLRDSGAIEQDADVVLFIWDNPEDQRPNVKSVIVAKQRNGPTGIAELAWLPEYAWFDNIERRYGEREIA